MRTRNIIKVCVALIPAMIGVVLLVKDFKTQAAHPEWSVSPSIMWIKFAVLIAISIGLAIFLLKGKKYS